MPTMNMSTYLNDEDYEVYKKNKEELNNTARVAFFNAINKLKKEVS